MFKTLAALALVLLFACNTPSNEVVQPPAPETGSAPSAHNYGVSFSYGADFALEDASYAEKVIKVWRHYDANTMDSVRTYFADTVFNDLPGFTGKLQADSLLAIIKAERSAVDTIASSFDAILPAREKGKGEVVVAVWGVEKTTAKSGRQSRRDLQELWGFNKEGKISWIKQFELKRNN